MNHEMCRTTNHPNGMIFCIDHNVHIAMCEHDRGDHWRIDNPDGSYDRTYGKTKICPYCKPQPVASPTLMAPNTTEIRRYMRDAEMNLHDHKDGELCFYTDVAKMRADHLAAMSDIKNSAFRKYTDYEDRIKVMKAEVTRLQNLRLGDLEMRKSLESQLHDRDAEVNKEANKKISHLRGYKGGPDDQEYWMREMPFMFECWLKQRKEIDFLKEQVGDKENQRISYKLSFESALIDKNSLKDQLKEKDSLIAQLLAEPSYKQGYNDCWENAVKPRNKKLKGLEAEVVKLMALVQQVADAREGAINDGLIIKPLQMVFASTACEKALMRGKI